MAQPMNCYRQVQDIPDSGWGYIGGEWYVRPPGRRMAARLGHHEVTEHIDGTITVRPSIIYSTTIHEDYWHGWLTKGRWRSA